ncbi:MAG TPA: C69 family dipeptidase, partial [Actinopolymorphaceae bacterium]
KSYGIYVDRDLTEDGYTLLGGTGDEVSSHWLRIEEAADHPAGSKIEVGVTKDAAMPGKLIEIPQARHTFKYISMDYSDFEGFPPPLTNGGINEHQVAVRDIWSDSREELVEMTPAPQTGLQYSDEARIALERARTAREATRLIGDLIDRYGHATYGGNSHLIADEKEGWVILEFAGGKGLWVAERLGPDDVRMSYPGYIQRIPVKCNDHPDFMCSDNFVEFAEKQGWWKPGRPFDVNKVYGAGWNYRTEPASGKFVAPATIENELKQKAPVSLTEFMETVRDPRISADRNGYGQVAQLRPGVDRDLVKLWVAPIGSVTSPFLPYHIGVQSVPPEFRQHRYLTKDSGSTFLNPKFARQEATAFAGRLYKRLLYHTCTNPEKYYPEVHDALSAFERRLRQDQPPVEQTAQTLIDAGKRDLARRYLTEYSHTKAAEAMRIGEALVDSIETRSKLDRDIPEPPASEDINGGSSAIGGYVTCYRR